MNISPMQLNPAESRLANAGPVPGQSPLPAVLASFARGANGLGDVPNDLAGAFLGGGPAGAILGALNEPPPSLTATVTANPALAYGDKHVENLVGASKAATSFVVTSGSSKAKAETGMPIPTIAFIVAGVVAIGAILVFRK